MNLRTGLLTGLVCLALLVCLGYLTAIAVALLRSGNAAAVALGVGVAVLVAVGGWAAVATVRAGFTHQRLARLAGRDGAELDVSTLPRTPSGRVRLESADVLFQTVRAEVEAQPGDWLAWYRLARAYDHAGDRSRARESMRTAVTLEENARRIRSATQT